MTRIAGAGTLALAVSVSAAYGAQSGPRSITVLRDGAAAAAMEVALMAADGPKPLGRTGADGVLDIALAAANDVKRMRVQVVIEQCPDAQERLLLIMEGVALDERGCKRRLLAIVWWNRGRSLVVDLTRGTVATDGTLLTGRNLAIGGGVVGVAALALALSGSDSAATNTPTNTPVDLSSVYGSYNGTLSVTGGTGCVQTGSSPVPITLSGNADGSNFVLNKGGLIFRGTLTAARTFDVEYVGPISGFPGLPNNTNIRWRVTGTVPGQLSGSGELNVTSGACNQNVIRTSVLANKA